jgi:hypothetical protein
MHRRKQISYMAQGINTVYAKPLEKMETYTTEVKGKWTNKKSSYGRNGDQWKRRWKTVG